MLFSLLKHYLDTDTALKVSQSVYCFTTSISHGVKKYFPRLWGTDIADAIFELCNKILSEKSPKQKDNSGFVIQILIQNMFEEDHTIGRPHIM